VVEPVCSLAVSTHQFVLAVIHAVVWPVAVVVSLWVFARASDGRVAVRVKKGKGRREAYPEVADRLAQLAADPGQMYIPVSVRATYPDWADVAREVLWQLAVDLDGDPDRAQARMHKNGLMKKASPDDDEGSGPAR
jgi:hypothetical protein